MNLAGLVIEATEGFVDFHNIERRFPNNPHVDKLKYLRGFVIRYTNGWISVSGGGGASGYDAMWIHFIDQNGFIVWEDEETM